MVLSTWTPQPFNLIGAFPSSVPSGQPAGVFRVPLSHLSSVPSMRSEHASWVLKQTQTQPLSHFGIPLTTRMYVPFHSLLLSDVDERERKETAQHPIINRKREGMGENICPWVRSSTHSLLTPPVKKMPGHLPGESLISHLGYGRK